MSEDILERAKAALKRHDPLSQGFYTSMPFEDIQALKDLIAEVEANQIMLRQFQVHEDQTHAAMEGLLGNSDNFIELAREMKEEVGRLRSENNGYLRERTKWFNDSLHMQLTINSQKEDIAAKDARIDLLDSDQKRYHAAWMAAEEDKEEQAARIKELEAEVEAKNKQIKELQDIIDKPPEDADWVADYHLLQSALDGPIIDAARKWHAAYRKAQNSNLMRAKEVERLQSAPKSGLYGKYIIQKADGSPVDPEADYFILRLDADPVARIAALEYAIQTDDQKLGEMLEKRVMDHVFSKDDQCRKRVEGWPIGQIKQLRKQIAAKDARIKELEEANRNIDKRRDEMAAFIERLEAAFLDAKAERNFVLSNPLGSHPTERMEKARQGAIEALERIRNDLKLDTDKIKPATDISCRLGGAGVD